jgi:hypothetical protein
LNPKDAHAGQEDLRFMAKEMQRCFSPPWQLA